MPGGTSGCSLLEVPPILAPPVVSFWGWIGFPKRMNFSVSAFGDLFLAFPEKEPCSLFGHVQLYHVCYYCLIASNFLAASMFFLCPFCLFSAPKYKWLFSPSSSFSLSLSSSFFLRMASVSLLAPVPGRTNLLMGQLFHEGKKHDFSYTKTKTWFSWELFEKKVYLYWVYLK